MNNPETVEITNGAGVYRMEISYSSHDFICDIQMFLDILNSRLDIVPHARIYFQNMMAHGFKTILNIGCGDDPARLNKNFGATNLDLWDEVETKYADQYTKFVKSNIYIMPFEDKSYECSVLGDIMEHLTKPELALKEVLRVTSRRIVATVPSGEFDEKIARPEHNKVAENRMKQLLKEKTGFDTTGLTFNQVQDLVRLRMPLDQTLDHVQRFDTDSIKKLFYGAEILFTSSPDWVGFFITWNL